AFGHPAHLTSFAPERSLEATAAHGRLKPRPLSQGALLAWHPFRRGPISKDDRETCAAPSLCSRAGSSASPIRAGAFGAAATPGAERNHGEDAKSGPPASPYPAR